MKKHIALSIAFALTTASSFAMEANEHTLVAPTASTQSPEQYSVSSGDMELLGQARQARIAFKRHHISRQEYIARLIGLAKVARRQRYATSLRRINTLRGDLRASATIRGRGQAGDESDIE